MATFKGMYRILSSTKSNLKIVVATALVIFILVKLFGGATTSQNDGLSVGTNLDQKIEGFQLQKNAVSENHHTAAAAEVKKLDDSANAERSKRNSMWNWTDSMPKNAVYVMIPFARVKHNPVLQAKFTTCVTSMSKMSSAPIVLFVAGDVESRGLAEDVVKSLSNKNVQLHFVDVEALGAEMKDTISTFQKYFSYQPGAYYSHTVFLVSTAIHRLAPPDLHRLIMLDADLKFQADIQLLHDLFHKFSDNNVIGIAHENQPVYRHVLSIYRQANPGTRAGEPAPEGLPGFNSGVLLMDLDRMRKSGRYNALLDADVVDMLAKKYSYKGHLGDQDFYSLLSLDNEDLFYVLPCTWNRQLCQWWRDKGYNDVFDSYFTCEGKVNIYHGNCNTPFPPE